MAKSNKKPETPVGNEKRPMYPPGKYICEKPCFDNTKYYYRGDVRIVDAATQDLSLKHFRPAKPETSANNAPDDPLA